MAVRDLLDTIAKEALGPTLRALADEARQPIEVLVTLMDRGNAVASTKLSVNDDADQPTSHGEVRVVIKRSDSESAVFEAQAIIQGLATGTGLSGLAIRGKVSTRAGMASAKLTGKSIRYNVWEWDPRFRRPTG